MTPAGPARPITAPVSEPQAAVPPPEPRSNVGMVVLGIGLTVVAGVGAWRFSRPAEVAPEAVLPLSRTVAAVPAR